MPCSGMKSPACWAPGAVTGWVLKGASWLRGGTTYFMVALSIAALKRDPLRRMAHLPRNGRHRPADRCASSSERAAVVPEHRDAGVAVGQRGEAPGRPRERRRGLPLL